MQGSGTLDHKLVGKLQQLQQLYPSIVKLHQRKQVSPLRRIRTTAVISLIDDAHMC